MLWQENTQLQGGKYSIIEVLAEGAFGTTYLAKTRDAKTGDLRWKLTAEEGSTENDLQGASIKGIKAEVYKNNEIVFKLTAPLAKADHNKKEILLLGEVTAENDTGDFQLKTKQ